MRDKLIYKSLDYLSRFSDLSRKHYGKPVTIAFSGGKDSIVLYHLSKLTGLKFDYVMQNTTIEMPSTLPFVRSNFQDVRIEQPNLNFFDLVRKKGYLPTIRSRFCCHYLKEVKVKNSIVFTGVRKAESWKRSSRKAVERLQRGKRITFEENNADALLLDECMSKRKNIVINPLIEWSDSLIWQYIDYQKLPLPISYSLGYNRLGCVFCPLASRKTQILDCKHYKQYIPHYLKLIKELVISNNYCNHLSDNEHIIFDWWLSKLSVDEYRSKYLCVKHFCVYDWVSGSGL